jgi:hypothetical protein
MRTSFTKEQDARIAEKYVGGMTARQIAGIFGVYHQSILNSLKRSGIKRRKDWGRAFGEKNGAWRGGIRMVKGYRHLFRPGHRLARKDSWVAEHRLFMDSKIVNRRQIIHHKDGNRLNNNLENLEVVPSNSKHISRHALEWKRDHGGRWVKNA